MKKMNILFILITLIMIFGTTNVFALNVDNYWLGTSSSGWSSDTGSTYSTTFNNVSGSLYKELVPNNISLKGNDYLQINASLFITNTIDSSLININNINFTETCSHYHDNETRYRIIYADGSTATIESSMYSNFCDIHNQTGNASGTIANNIRVNPILNVGITMLNDNNQENVFWCTNTGGSSYTCPIASGWTFEKLSFFGNLGGASANYKIMVARNMYMYKSEAQAIINNQNQNTNTINNSINDTKDTITSNTIDSNTNTDNLITIPNSNGKNTILDLLMVPINFITSIVNSFSNSCVSYNLGNLLGTDLILPCINLQNILGSSLYNIIDAIFAFGMIFAFIRSVKKFIQKSLLLASDVSSEVSIF